MKEFKNAMSLKAHIKNEAIKKQVPAQVIMQNYMMERLLERISLSRYKNNFILKGGFLISAIVGVDTRTTMDMDATIKGINVQKENIKNIFTEIINVTINDNIQFHIKRLENIREGDQYPGIRLFLEAVSPPLRVPLSIDITTGDKITPKEINYNFKLMFEDRKIEVLAYNLETILAEKIETIVSRQNSNTRMRDFYDVYILYKIFKNDLNIKQFSESLKATSIKRKSNNLFLNSPEIIDRIKENDTINSLWTNYQKDFRYAENIKIADVCLIIKNLLASI